MERCVLFIIIIKCDDFNMYLAVLCIQLLPRRNHNERTALVASIPLSCTQSTQPIYIKIYEKSYTHALVTLHARADNFAGVRNRFHLAPWFFHSRIRILYESSVRNNYLIHQLNVQVVAHFSLRTSLQTTQSRYGQTVYDESRGRKK